MSTFYEIQVHLQTQSSAGMRGTQMAMHIVRTQGVFALYNGISASIGRQVKCGFRKQFHKGWHFLTRLDSQQKNYVLLENVHGKLYNPSLVSVMCTNAYCKFASNVFIHCYKIKFILSPAIRN